MLKPFSSIKLLNTQLRNYSSKTAGAIIIADEILTGKTKDINANFLSKLLFERGIKLKQIRVIGDDVDTIVKTASEFSKDFDYVFTSGGIGHTHDDLTYFSLAKAFNRKLEYHEETIKKMKEIMSKRGTKLNEERKLMALLPEDTKKYYTPELWVPLVQLENIFILPGIPQLFEKMLVANIDKFVERTEIDRKLVYTDQYEGEFSLVLKEIVKKYQNVSIGSYPTIEKERGYACCISIEGKPNEVEEPAKEITEKINGRSKPFKSVE
eukprot:gene6592-10755_t